MTDLPDDPWPDDIVPHGFGMCGRCYDVLPLAALQTANCLSHQLTPGPIGMYHCRDCGAMVLAGVPHPPLCLRCNTLTHPRFDSGGT